MSLGERTEKDQILKPELLRSIQQLETFWKIYRRNNGLSFQDSKTEDFSAKMDAKKLLEKIEAGTEIPAGVELGGEMIATGKLSIRETEKNKKEGYLGFLTVDEKHQGKGIANDVINTLMTAASEHGCARVLAEVLVENSFGSRSVGSLLKNGFLLESIAEGDMQEAGKFILAKSFEDEAIEKEKKDQQIEKIPITETAAIKKLLSQGYKGTKLLRSGEDQFILELQKYGR